MGSKSTAPVIIHELLSCLAQAPLKAIEPCGESPDSLTYRLHPLACSPGFLGYLTRSVGSVRRRRQAWFLTVSKTDAVRKIPYQALEAAGRALSDSVRSMTSSDALLTRWRSSLQVDATTTGNGSTSGLH